MVEIHSWWPKNVGLPLPLCLTLVFVPVELILFSHPGKRKLEVNGGILHRDSVFDSGFDSGFDSVSTQFRLSFDSVFD